MVCLAYLNFSYKVQESLYKIHRYLLEHHSDYFRRVVAEGNDLLGRSDESPLPLPADITQQMFDCLLDFLYHGSASFHVRYSWY